VISSCSAAPVHHYHVVCVQPTQMMEANNRDCTVAMDMTIGYLDGESLTVAKDSQGEEQLILDKASYDPEAFRRKVKRQCVIDQVSEAVKMLAFMIAYLVCGTLFFSLTEKWCTTARPLPAKYPASFLSTIAGLLLCSSRLSCAASFPVFLRT
jgi:hypothetical protein